jgi:NAD(P)-dependent dehydrogenase (short-subunit alcohol dehydrogenase family)
MTFKLPHDYQPAADLLRQRIILITGSGDGIGAAAAESFAAHGATVILLGRTIKKLERVYDRIVAAGHPQPAIFPMDLEGAKPEHYQQLADALRQEFGRLDGLLHNAAQLGALMPLEHYDPQLWGRLLQVNLTAPFLMTRALLPLLKQAAEASIVFTSSAVAQRGLAYWGAYGASKAGADNLMQTLADELETNTAIRCNSIDPGAVRTAMRRLAFPGEDPSTLPEPVELMDAYLYLFGPDSHSVNGQILCIERD